VAIKAVPPRLSDDPEGRARLEREVRALSELAHPNIGAVHEVIRETDRDFLVAQFVEGVTLAERLKKGPLPLDEAVQAAISMADALNAAHRAGVIHGNLKPSNVMLTKEGALRQGSGQVRLVDFGMALWEQPAPASPAQGSDKRAKATLPDVPDDIVRYLSPERIEGREADARSDIFAFGAILYEMVTGTKAFEGRNRPMLVAAIATLDPYPLSKTQPDSPAMLDHIAQRCLAKDPDDRWQTAHDLLVQLRWVTEGGDVLLARARQKRERRMLAVLTTGVFLATALAGVAAFLWGRGGDTGTLQFRVPVAGLSSGDIAISPDGKLLAVVARPNSADNPSLYVRPTGSTEFVKLVGSEDATLPFWSPDSRSIGFAVGGRLKRVDASGGAPKDLGEAPGFTGGAWGSSQVILFGSAKGLVRVSAEGGKSEAATVLDKEEAGHYWPSFLPDGQHYLYLAWSANAANRAIYTGALGSKDRTKLMSADSNVTYAQPGYVLFHREATLFAQAFDAGKLALTGEPVHLADQLDFSPANGHGAFGASQQGALVYFQSQGGRGGPAGRGAMANNYQWGWRDRTGRAIAPAGETGTYGDMDLSPDGKLIAVTAPDASAAGADIWIIDWQRAGVANRLTLDPGDDINPVWSHPTGDRVAFTTYRKGNADIYIKNANGTGDETPLLATPANESIEAWSNDGRYIAYKQGSDGIEDIWILPLFGDKKPFPMVEGPFHKDEPQFSYDGKWLAYTSDESGGKFQVFIVSFPGREQRLQVSKDGGGQPRWREDGKELFFRSPDNGAMAVDVTSVPRLAAGVPHQLFVGFNTATGRDPVRHQWAVTPNGQQFLLRVPTSAAARGRGVAIPFGAPGAAGQPAAAGAQQAFVSSGLTVIRNWPVLFQKKPQ
jgi:Tol biopolymer transport system component